MELSDWSSDVTRVNIRNEKQPEVQPFFPSRKIKPYCQSPKILIQTVGLKCRYLELVSILAY